MNKYFELCPLCGYQIVEGEEVVDYNGQLAHKDCVLTEVEEASFEYMDRENV